MSKGLPTKSVAFPEFDEEERGRVVDFRDAAARLRASAPCATDTAPAIAVSPSDRLTLETATRRGKWAALLACSIAAHLALYLPFARDPDPMASIGEHVIT